MKLRSLFALFNAIVLIQVAAPAMALQCTNQSIDLIAKAIPAQAVESNVFDCILEGEAAVHLTGKLVSSLVLARGYAGIRFLDQQGKQLWMPRSGPWMGTFSGFVFDESFAVPPNATRIHIVAQIETGSKEAAGEWRIAGLMASPGTVVTGDAAEGSVISATQAARWRFSTVPAGAQGTFQAELRDLAGQIKGTRSILKTGTQTEVDFGKLPTGYYQMHVRFTPEHADAGTWTSTLVVLPNGDPPNEPRFGIDGALSWYLGGKAETVMQSVKMMRQAGVGSVRDRMSWSEVQPTRQRLEWGRFGKTAEIIAQAGMETVQVFVDSPVWTRPGGSPQTTFQVPLDDNAVFEFGQIYAKGLGKTVRNVEYWNEQNAGFFPGYPFQYANGLKSFFAGIKSVDPGIRVLIGAAASVPGQFFEEIYNNGAAGFFDTRNLHYYAEINGLDKFLDAHLASMERNASVAGRPGWITETGYSLRRDAHGDWGTAEREQAEYLVKTYMSGFAAGYERVFFFFWGEMVENDLHTWGILRKDFSPRPAYLTLALLTRHLAGASLVASERHGAGHTIYFRRNDGSLVAVTWGGGAPINRLGVKVEVRDIFGQQLDSASAGSSPLLLSQIDKLPEQAKSVNLPPEQLRGPPPLWLSARVLINGKNLEYRGNEKHLARVSERATIEIAARAFLIDPKTEKITADCVPGPGLTVISPAQFTIEHPKPSGEAFTCRFQTNNLVAVGKSYATVRARSGNSDDTVRIALIPDTASAGATKNIATRPLMPNGACPGWIPRHSPNIVLAIEPARNTQGICPVSVTGHVNQSRNNTWASPSIPLPANELNAALGLRLQISQIPGYSFPPLPLRLQLYEKNGGIWITELQSDDGGRVYSALFNLARPAPWARNSNGRLDLGNVQQILVGWGGHSAVAGQRYGFMIEATDLLLKPE
ncbi:MAG: hypothetical protein FWD67_01385 [Betaproteobacteria bacterium]|nr:hypothetical protein [Betaproteobacteria bacterium]